jgi:ectoine utilization protein EutC
VLLLDEQQIRQCVQLDRRALEAIEKAFVSLSRGEAVVPSPLEFHLAERNGEVHVKSAYLRGLPSYVLKIASGFYGNAARGLPTSSGLVVVLSTETGFPQALLLDNGYLTDVRTALAGAIAAKYLARKNVEAIGIVGAGIQARFQLQALALVRKFRNVLVYARSAAAARKYADEMSAAVKVEVKSSSSISDLVQRSEIVVTTTPAREPLVSANDLHPGLHITAMGSDLPGKQELEPAVLARADILACDLIAQCVKAGELQHALAAKAVDKGKAVELGEVIAGTKPGRQNDNQITVCDLTGIGVQDTAIGMFAYEQARARGLGTELSQ